MRTSPLRIGRRCATGGNEGQLNAEQGSADIRHFHLYSATATLDNLFHDRQSQTGPPLILPLLSLLPRTNRLKTFGSKSASIPGPVSATVITIQSYPTSPPTVMTPPAGGNFKALVSRLFNTCSKPVIVSGTCTRRSGSVA